MPTLEYLYVVEYTHCILTLTESPARYPDWSASE